MTSFVESSNETKPMTTDHILSQMLQWKFDESVKTRIIFEDNAQEVKKETLTILNPNTTEIQNIPESEKSIKHDLLYTSLKEKEDNNNVSTSLSKCIQLVKGEKYADHTLTQNKEISNVNEMISTNSLENLQEKNIVNPTHTENDILKLYEELEELVELEKRDEQQQNTNQTIRLNKHIKITQRKPNKNNNYDIKKNTNEKEQNTSLTLLEETNSSKQTGTDHANKVDNSSQNKSTMHSVISSIIDNLIEIIPLLNDFMTVQHFEKNNTEKMMKLETNLNMKKQTNFKVSYMSIVSFILPNRNNINFWNDFKQSYKEIGEQKNIGQENMQKIYFLTKENIIWAQKVFNELQNTTPQNNLKSPGQAPKSPPRGIPASLNFKKGPPGRQLSISFASAGHNTCIDKTQIQETMHDQNIKKAPIRELHSSSISPHQRKKKKVVHIPNQSTKKFLPSIDNTNIRDDGQNPSQICTSVYFQQKPTTTVSSQHNNMFPINQTRRGGANLFTSTNNQPIQSHGSQTNVNSNANTLRSILQSDQTSTHTISNNHKNTFGELGNNQPNQHTFHGRQSTSRVRSDILPSQHRHPDCATINNTLTNNNIQFTQNKPNLPSYYEHKHNPNRGTNTQMLHNFNPEAPFANGGDNHNHGSMTNQSQLRNDTYAPPLTYLQNQIRPPENRVVSNFNKKSIGELQHQQSQQIIHYNNMTRNIYENSSGHLLNNQYTVPINQSVLRYGENSNGHIFFENQQNLNLLNENSISVRSNLTIANVQRLQNYSSNNETSHLFSTPNVNRNVNPQSVQERSISRDSGFMSPLHERSELEMLLTLSEEPEKIENTNSIVITHITSLNPNAEQCLLQNCTVCLNPTKLNCSSCSQKPYCSPQCQHQDWPNHSMYCRQL